MATGRSVMLRREKGRQVSEMMDWRYTQKQMSNRKKFPSSLYTFQIHIFQKLHNCNFSSILIPFLIPFIKTALERSLPEQR